MVSPPIIIDCGTGYIKLGFGGNQSPSWVIPTVVAFDGFRGHNGGRGPTTLPLELPFGGPPPGSSILMGTQAKMLWDRRAASSSLDFIWPLSEGIINPFPSGQGKGGQERVWDAVEQMYFGCYAKYLCCDPRDRPLILSEPPLTPSWARERLSEIMFESLGVPFLRIGVQAVLALYSHIQDQQKEKSDFRQGLTGCVLDIGEGLSHVVPVLDGRVHGGAVREIDLAGKDVTRFIQSALEKRGEPIPSCALHRAAKKIKEKYCYLSSDFRKEILKYDQNPSLFQAFSVRDPTLGEIHCDVGYEKFMAPEIFFNTGLVPPSRSGASSSLPPLSVPEAVCESIEDCPMDCRKPLYKNIVLSGGSTLIKNFGRRLKKEVTLLSTEARWRRIKVSECSPEVMNVSVVSHSNQRFAVWNGASVISATHNTEALYVSKAMYEEHGSYRLFHENELFAPF